MDKPLRKFLRLRQVREATGHCTSWIYEAMRRGDFPAPIRIGAKAVAWDASDIANWQARRIEQSRKPAA